jgi:hypothetical protein
VWELPRHIPNCSSFRSPRTLRRSEDGTVKLWHATTYRLESTLDYRMERVWSIGYLKARPRHDGMVPGSACMAASFCGNPSVAY